MSNVISYPSIPNVDLLSDQEITSAGADRTPGHQITEGLLRGATRTLVLGVFWTQKITVTTPIGGSGIPYTVNFTHNLGFAPIVFFAGKRTTSAGVVNYFSNNGMRNNPPGLLVGSGGIYQWGIVDPNTIYVYHETSATTTYTLEYTMNLAKII